MKAYSKSVLIFGDDECFIKFWNWEENQIIDKILGHGGSVTYLHPSEYFLLTGGGDHVFKVIEAKRIQND